MNNNLHDQTGGATRPAARPATEGLQTKCCSDEVTRQTQTKSQGKLREHHHRDSNTRLQGAPPPKLLLGSSRAERPKHSLQPRSTSRHSWSHEKAEIPSQTYHRQGMSVTLHFTEAAAIRTQLLQYGTCSANLPDNTTSLLQSGRKGHTVAAI